MNIISRIWSRVKVNGETGCWEWTGGKNRRGGYGRIKVNNSMQLTHRIIFFSVFPYISQELKVLHRCDNPACNNPEHMFAGTQAENIADMDRKGRRVLVNVRGERCGAAKLTEANVIEIRAMPGTIRFIARRFGVADATIRDIKRRKNWKHVP